MIPLLSHSVQQRLVQLAIDTIDFAYENLPDSLYFFRVINLIVERSKHIKNENELLNNSLKIICDKITYILKDGINTYIANHKESSPNYIKGSINISCMVKFFNTYGFTPEDYIKLMQDVEFVKLFCSSKQFSLVPFMKNYIRARELNLFDVNAFLLSFYEKESSHMDVDMLFESIYTVFKEEVFEIIPRLKFKYYNDGSISQKEAQVIYPSLSNDKDVQLILFNHLNCWLPSIVLYDAKYNTDTFNVHFSYHISSMKLATRDLIFSPNNDLKMENVAFDVIHYLFGCLDEMKDLLSKNDDFSSSLLFPAYKYRAVHLLMFLKGILKMVDLNYIEKSKNIDYLPVIDFGEFLVNGHSHPFGEVLKNRCTKNFSNENAIVH